MSESIDRKASAVSAAGTPVPNYLAPPKICHNLSCSFQTHEALTRCPKCGRPIWTTNEFRLISSVLIFCGLFFVALGGGLMYTVGPIDRTSGFTGSEGQRVFIFGIFAAILALGVSIVAAGTWQVVIGKPSRKLIYIMLTSFLVMLTIVGTGRLILSLLSD